MQLEAASNAEGTVAVSVFIPEVIILNYSDQALSDETSRSATPVMSACESGSSPTGDNEDPVEFRWQVNGFSPGGNACVKLSATCTNPATGNTVTMATTTSALEYKAKSNAASVSLALSIKNMPPTASLITASTI
ncbi:hypothetical protein [Chlorobium limicola]|uniref:Uncharacterized protein n=1 Tax=Chlorobium limicola TaxID=1092 RepID=A0A101JSU8_CHLLI|nr:hypothetical protein [Chlorobium limicola]KUL32435.1 hypothetical protein ASB62_01860 [Chlorobium limicola]